MSIDRDPETADETLMARSAGGDRAAFAALCTRHLARLYVLALRVAGDPAEAEEIAQETMVRAWRQAGRFDPACGSAAGWLNRITVNLAIDKRRGAVRHTALPPGLASEAPDAEDALQRRDRRAALMAGLAALPARQRAALVLTYFEERAGQDAARSLGISVRALEGLLRRGRLFLRDWLRAREV